VLDAAARRLIKRVKLGRDPEGLLVAPDGSFVYVAVEGENHLAKVDLKTFTVTGLISTGVGPDGMAWVKAQ
jgi:DNA-binding beta-propeller fold protein YncE